MKPKSVHPLIGYFGGKSRVADKIIKLIPPHNSYAEPFVGSLAVLLKKPQSKNEVANDLDTELINLYKVAKYRLGEMLDAVKDIPMSRRLWLDFLQADPIFLNDVTRAVRKLYIIRLSFAARSYNFGVDKNRNRFITTQTLKEWLVQFQDRTRRVVFECLDANIFIEKYDTEKTFFYLDPVYLDKDDYTQKFGGLKQLTNLRDTLKRCKGQWLLSHHDCPEVRELFKKFKLQRLAVNYTNRGGGYHKKARELLISNY